MTVLMVVLMFATIALIELLVMHSRGRAHELSMQRGAERKKKAIRLRSERYYHPAHTWMQLADGEGIVGSDEFVIRALGVPENVELPPVGMHVSQGDPLWKIRRGTRTVVQMSPIEGVVLNANQALSKNPDLLHDAPYSKGWVAVIKPTALKANLKNLLHGAIAEMWMDQAKRLVIQRLSPRLGVTYQDGGDLVDGFGELMSDEEWEKFSREFFAAE